jgi:hypothetical protein
VTCGMHGESNFVRGTLTKVKLQRPRRRWQNSIKRNSNIRVWQGWSVHVIGMDSCEVM